MTGSVTGPLPPPDRSLRACVVVPARDEQDRIGRCIDALAAQERVRRAEFEVILVLDRCADATADRALQAARCHAGLRLRMLAAGDPGPGAARRLGMDVAAERLEAVGRPRGLIASTDADTRPRPDWLARQLELVAAGAEAVGGLIEVDAGEAGDEVMRRRAARLEARARAAGAGADAHPFFSGASLGLTVGAYRAAGGLRPLAALEDQALERSLAERGVPIVRSREVRVLTSGRTDGRARHGLAADLRLDDWAGPAHVPCRRLGPGGAGGAQARDGVGDPPGARGGGHDRPDHRRHRPAGAPGVGGRAAGGRCGVARRHRRRGAGARRAGGAGVGGAARRGAVPREGRRDVAWPGGHGGRRGGLRQRGHRRLRRVVRHGPAGPAGRTTPRWRW